MMPGRWSESAVIPDYHFLLILRPCGYYFGSKSVFIRRYVVSNKSREPERVWIISGLEIPLTGNVALNIQDLLPVHMHSDIRI
jgi:hypothetical protein